MCILKRLYLSDLVHSMHNMTVCVCVCFVNICMCDCCVYVWVLVYRKFIALALTPADINAVNDILSEGQFFFV